MSILKNIDMVLNNIRKNKVDKNKIYDKIIII